MFFIDKPYISELFKETLRINKLPIVGTGQALSMLNDDGYNIIDEAQAVLWISSNPATPIYLTSENALEWIYGKLGSTPYPSHIKYFKDKSEFRKLISSIYPGFFFKKVSLNRLEDIDLSEIPFPCVVKPAVGFFSIGVQTVLDRADWQKTVGAISSAISQNHNYPPEVCDTDTFIIEEYIEGDEFAVDAYFDRSGEPVILGIYRHVFSSKSDVSDRVYVTSREIILQNLEQFTSLLREIGKLSGLKQFPMHLELRRKDDTITPIEINPMRFGGWCTTADMTLTAFGINPYMEYYNQTAPDWSSVLSEAPGDSFCIVVLDNSTGIDSQGIKSFDYERLLSHFTKPLELRRINHNEHNIFGFLFVQTESEHSEEIQGILKSDLREYVKI